MADLRKLIREYLVELEPMILESLLDETQKDPVVDKHINYALNIMEPIGLPEGVNVKEIKDEIRNKIYAKLNQIQINNYSFKDFLIFKLGLFYIKNGEKTTRFIFYMGDVDKEGDKKNASLFYVYVYRNVIKELNYASDFYIDNNLLIQKAQRFIKSNNINLTTKTEQGKIDIKTDFSSDNIVDITNYGSSTAIATSKIQPALAKEKMAYKKGGKLNHPRFGKGTITKVRKQGTDAEGNETYWLTVQFPDKERIVQMVPKKREPATV